MRNFAGMSHGDRRKLFERAAFERFCDAREIQILQGTFEQPAAPAPDIRVTIVGEGPVAFELVCLDDDAGQERLNLMGDAQALIRQYHQEMDPIQCAAFDGAFRDAFTMIAFVSSSGKRGVRKALPGLFEMLMQLPRGAMVTILSPRTELSVFTSRARLLLKGPNSRPQAGDLSGR
jgi:hypothetical protein